MIITVYFPDKFELQPLLSKNFRIYVEVFINNKQIQVFYQQGDILFLNNNRADVLSEGKWQQIRGNSKQKRRVLIYEKTNKTSEVIQECIILQKRFNLVLYTTTRRMSCTSQLYFNIFSDGQIMKYIITIKTLFICYIMI